MLYIFNRHKDKGVVLSDYEIVTYPNIHFRDTSIFTIVSPKVVITTGVI